VIFTDGNVAKLCDFSISKQLSKEEVENEDFAYFTQTVGTVPSMAPEFLSEREFTRKADVYSFGILMC